MWRDYLEDGLSGVFGRIKAAIWTLISRCSIAIAADNVLFLLKSIFSAEYYY